MERSKRINKENEKLGSKIDIYITLIIGYFFIICISFGYLELGKTLEGYIMLTTLALIALISFYLGRTASLISAMGVDFIYCSYKLYISVSKGIVLGNKDIYWIIILPITALLISKVSHLILYMQIRINDLEEDNKKYVLIDENTGVKNGRAFINEIPIYMNLHKRHNMSVTLLLVKIKHSKKLVKIVGNEFFNIIIKTCSEAVNETLRYEDAKYLIDKNTFAFILICNEDGAVVVKNKMKETVKAVKVGNEKFYRDLNIEIQIGAFTQNEQVVDAMSFINLAEKELEYDV